jgi:hypothetical protein
MKRNAFLIVALLVAFISAPIVDAIACDDCKHIIPRRDLSQRSEKGYEHSACSVSSSDACASDSQRTATARDLCPVCSNIAAAMGNACCGAPTMISETNHLPKLLALSDPSFPITKPPQN